MSSSSVGGRRPILSSTASSDLRSHKACSWRLDQRNLPRFVNSVRSRMLNSLTCPLRQI